MWSTTQSDMPKGFISQQRVNGCDVANSIVVEGSFDQSIFWTLEPVVVHGVAGYLTRLYSCCYQQGARLHHVGLVPGTTEQDSQCPPLM